MVYIWYIWCKERLVHVDKCYLHAGATSKVLFVDQPYITEFRSVLGQRVLPSASCRAFPPVPAPVTCDINPKILGENSFVWIFDKIQQNIFDSEPRFANKICDFHLTSISCWPPGGRCGRKALSRLAFACRLCSAASCHKGGRGKPVHWVSALLCRL